MGAKFNIVTASRIYSFKAEDKMKGEEWVSVINDAVRDQAAISKGKMHELKQKREATPRTPACLTAAFTWTQHINEFVGSPMHASMTPRGKQPGQFSTSSSSSFGKKSTPGEQRGGDLGLGSSLRRMSASQPAGIHS